MDWLLLAGLGIMWLAFLLPSARRRPSPSTTVEHFERRMELLAQAEMHGDAGRWIITPRKGVRFVGSAERKRARARERRKQVFVFLLESIGITFLIGLVPPLRAVWTLTAVLGGLLLAYVYLLITIKQRAGHPDAQLRAAQAPDHTSRASPSATWRRAPAAGRVRWSTDSVCSARATPSRGREARRPGERGRHLIPGPAWTSSSSPPTSIAASTGPPPLANRRCRPPAALYPRLRQLELRAIHRLEFDRAAALIEESNAALRDGLEAVRDHPAVRFAGYLQDAQKEYAEANITLAVVQGGPLPTPESLDIEDAPFLNGMADDRRGSPPRPRPAATREVDEGELSRSVTRTCTGCASRTHYPDAVTLNLRRSTDIARSLIEKTWGDLSIAFVQRDMHDALDRRAREVRGDAGP